MLMSHALTRKRPQINGRVAPRLDDFLSAVRDTNPFAANRVTEPSPYDVDVPAIHATEFNQLVDLSAKVSRHGSGIGIALLGGAGVGKSHLLSRLYRWANEPGQGGDPRACYVYINNILADPDRLPRYLLKYVVSRLSHGGQGPLHETRLYRFVERAIWHAIKTANAPANDAKAVQDAYRQYFKTGIEAGNPYAILFQFLRHARPEKVAEPRRRSLALSALGWLSGDEIDPVFAVQLGFKAQDNEPVMLRDDQEVEQVLKALSRLALLGGQPFILCVDQVDNIDPDKLKSLARFLHALLDHTPNLLVISSGVKQTLLTYSQDGVIPEAAWDRMAEYKVDLKRIPRQDARKILEVRLERFHEPFLEVEEVRRHLQEDTLFPLSRDWLETQLGDGIDFRPRDVLTWARDAWDYQKAELDRMGGETWLRSWPKGTRTKGLEVESLTPTELAAAIDGSVERKIVEQIAQHRLQPGSLPPDAGNLTGLVESLLAECQGDRMPYTLRSVARAKKKGGKLPPYDLLVRERRDQDGREVTTGVLFVTNVGLSATAALRRLLEEDPPPDHRLLVTDEQRRPLKVGAQGVEYYKDLSKLGHERFEHLKINFEQYAALDALRSVIGLARSGDLEIESPPGTPRPVTEAEVVASHHRKDRYRNHPLLRPLLTEEPLIDTGGSKKPVQLDEKDVRQYVMAQLAWMMGSTTQAIAKGYVGVMKPPKVTHEVAWLQIKAIAGKMHAEGLIHATPQDDDLLLLLRN
jgi:hypothetical protein